MAKKRKKAAKRRPAKRTAKRSTKKRAAKRKQVKRKAKKSTKKRAARSVRKPASRVKPAPGHTCGGSKGWAFLSMLLPFIGYLLTMIGKRDDKYAVYYAKQSLVFWLVAIILPIALLLTVVGAVLIPVVQILIVIWWLFGVINAVSGKQKPLPLIGRLAEKMR